MVPDLAGNTSGFLLLSITLAVGFFIYAFKNFLLFLVCGELLLQKGTESPQMCSLNLLK